MVVEAINVDKPKQRAYLLSHDSFKGMRGQILKYYIDEKLRIYGVGEDGSSQTGFGDHVIGRIEFASDPEQFKKKVKNNPQYENWEYEDSDDESSMKPSCMRITPSELALCQIILSFSLKTFMNLATSLSLTLNPVGKRKAFMYSKSSDFFMFCKFIITYL